MQAIISRAIRLWILQKKSALCKHLPCEASPPCRISLSRRGTSNGTRVDHFEGLCQVILEIDRYVVKDKLFAQRCQEFLDGIPRITRLYGSLQQSLQVIERLVIHGFYFENLQG